MKFCMHFMYFPRRGLKQEVKNRIYLGRRTQREQGGIGDYWDQYIYLEDFYI
jgi:hypothetical protein